MPKYIVVSQLADDVTIYSCAPTNDFDDWAEQNLPDYDKED